MNVDKHDLFRNVVPGFIFLIVVISFYGFTESLNNIKTNQIALVTLVAGFPLGFIIQHLYRIIFHIWRQEQRQMEEDDASIIRKICEDKTLSLEKGYDRCKDKDRALSHLFMFILSENSEWKSRIDFLFSYIHSLGASALAILMAIAFMGWVKTTRVTECWLLVIIWLGVAAIFYFGRKEIKSSCRASKEVFARIKKEVVLKHLGAAV